ncbi:MAG: hypothetical protein RDU30_10380 [Desulfovibrionaceae bacterium]|nr:hypothetical protein [Desulfovibrionaceae bacterium]
MDKPTISTTVRYFPLCKRSPAGSWIAGVLALFCILAFAHGAWALGVIFDTSKYKGDVWLQIQDPFSNDADNRFRATYNNGQSAITFGSQQIGGVTVYNLMSNPVKLSDIGAEGLNVAFSLSGVFFLFYDDPSLGANYLTTAPSVFDTLQRYQQFELTARGMPNTGDQGNLTNIDCFTAPLSIRSYQNSPLTNPSEPVLQSTGYGNTTALQIESLIKSAGGGASAKKTVHGQILRYIGPSKYDPNNTWLPPNPWPSFLSYAISLNGTQTQLIRSNGFGSPAWSSTRTYTFGIDMTATANDNGVITASGKVTASVINPASVAAGNPPLPDNGAWTDVSITLSPLTGKHTEASFNKAIYGQAAELMYDDKTGRWTVGNTAITLGSDWEKFQTFCINTLADPTKPHNINSNKSLQDLHAYDTTLSMAIGELTTGLLGGYFGSTVQGTTQGGVTKPIGEMESQQWWTLDPRVGFSQIQTDTGHYNRYADVIWTSSGNTVYGVPFSDRFGNGPLVNTVQTPGPNVRSVGYWVIGVGAPVGAPAGALPGATELLLLAD